LIGGPALPCPHGGRGLAKKRKASKGKEQKAVCWKGSNRVLTNPDPPKKRGERGQKPVPWKTWEKKSSEKRECENPTGLRAQTGEKKNRDGGGATN